MRRHEAWYWTLRRAGHLPMGLFFVGLPADPMPRAFASLADARDYWTAAQTPMSDLFCIRVGHEIVN